MCQRRLAIILAKAELVYTSKLRFLYMFVSSFFSLTISKFFFTLYHFFLLTPLNTLGPGLNIVCKHYLNNKGIVLINI